MHFSEQDYLSADGMLTSVWGPALWHVLHTISFNYPDDPSPEQKKQYYTFLMSLRHVLPCKYCRDNYAKNLRSVGLSKTTFASRQHFSRFIYDLHNEVNHMLGKSYNHNYEHVRNKYENFRSRCLEDPTQENCAHDVTPKLEKGCVEPMYGKKSKCVLRIVPKDSPHPTFKMARACKVRTRILH